MANWSCYTMSPQAVHILISKHQNDANNIANSILRRWKVRLDKSELTSAINLTLCQAAENFNPRFGTKFTTFLHYYIHGRLARTVKSEMEKDSPNSELVASYHANPSSVSNIRNYTPNNCETSAKSVDEIYEKKNSHLRMLNAMSRLDKLEREIIDGVFIQDLTVQEVAHRLELSRGYVSRLKASALRKMRGYIEQPLN